MGSVPLLVRVEVRSTAGEPHPALVEPADDGWLEWTPPADGWTERAVVTESQPADGIRQINAEVGEADVYMRAVFESVAGERFWGFGERSSSTEGSGSLIEHWVGEGPYQIKEYPLIEAITPRWAIRRRRDATYYPIPWLLSSRGFGALTDSPEWSCHDLTVPGFWSVIALTNRLTLRIFGGPSPADVLRRFSAATGRQPEPAAGWFLGPWISTGQADLVPLEKETAILDALQAAGAPLSCVETHMRRLPGGAHAARRDAERVRTSEFHGRGLGSLTYLSPCIAEDYDPVFTEFAANGALQGRADRTAYTYTAYIGGREPPVALQAQVDFSADTAINLYARFVDEAFDDGHDGWMEDFGEYTPLDSLESDGLTGAAAHNLYPLRYHRATAGIAASKQRTPARLVRSGWTGSAAFSPLVWGGDPTTGWDFDGLRSAVVQGLSMGLSGVAFWGSDIGGFFSLSDEHLTPELLIRWLQFGALSPLMRTKAGGMAIGGATRPQVWDLEVIPHWRRWASFHTRLNPYLMRAAAEYARTGMPLMRHHALTHPDDELLAARDDQYLLGPDLLVAPVLGMGLRRREVRLPAGEWIDLWRSVVIGDDGSMTKEDAVVLAGGRTYSIPAPIEEIPILMRAEARIPLLPAHVRSLYRLEHSEYEVFGWA